MEEETTASDWFEMGQYHSSLKNYRNAIECYQKCVKLDPEHYMAYSNIGAEYFQLKNYQKSIDACKQAIRINNDDMHAWLTLGANYFQLNEDERSLNCFERASDLGSKKARKFLSKAERLKDKLIEANVVDVLVEILEEQHLEEDVGDELPAIVYSFEVPVPGKKEYIKKLSDFLLVLGKHVIEETGGVISVMELFHLIRREVPEFKGNSMDLVKALKRLQKENLIEDLKTLKDSNVQIVEFIPAELTSDLKKIIELATDDGKVTLDEITAETSWDMYRIERAIKLLEEKDMARKVESYKDGTQYFFPSVELKKKRKK
ncbi:MAG: tetratricopeptide repeat protein [Candidatus Hodarchaeota archaeon]